MRESGQFLKDVKHCVLGDCVFLVEDNDEGFALCVLFNKFIVLFLKSFCSVNNVEYAVHVLETNFH